MRPINGGLSRPIARCAREAHVPMRRISVTATARLHFGFLDPSGRSKRPFGSFGLSLDRPATRLVLERAKAPHVTGPEHERAERYLEGHRGKLRGRTELCPPSDGGNSPSCRSRLGNAACARGRLGFLRSRRAWTYRRRRSRGGFSAAGAPASASSPSSKAAPSSMEALVPEMLCRSSEPGSPSRPHGACFSSSMRTRSGLAGASETAAFDQLPDFPESETEELHRRILQGALPALAASDFAGFCEQVGYLQAVMGSYFAPLQGGPYTSPAVSAVLDWLRDQGLTGIGQSSWGPTGFAFVPSRPKARRCSAQCERARTILGSASSWRKDATKARKSRRARCKFAKATPIERLCARAEYAKAGRSLKAGRSERPWRPPGSYTCSRRSST